MVSRVRWLHLGVFVERRQNVKECKAKLFAQKIRMIHKAEHLQWRFCELQLFSVFPCPRFHWLANCQTTYKENYGPWGVLGKLHHRQFYLRELQGLDNAAFKYDDRLEGMYPAPFYKLDKTVTAENLTFLTSLAEAVATGQKSSAINSAHQTSWRQLPYIIFGFVSLAV